MKNYILKRVIEKLTGSMEHKMKYGIGIDTGGTFTDCVLMDLDTKKIIKSSKTSTTHHNLEKGIENGLENLFSGLEIDKSEVAVAAVSSTLATNAVVENKGGEVALFIIGTEKHIELPVGGFKFIKGGHDIHGNEMEKLAIESIVDGALFFSGKADSFAIISTMSFVNPDHELVAKKAVEMIAKKPVYISSKVSSHPGMEERAATTVLNARLMPVMEEFIKGLETSLGKRIDPLKIKIIDGECHSSGLGETMEKSVKTFGSGPASTACFGCENMEKGLVVDIGGTTTDILLIENNKPVLTENSRIGKFDTHVKSVKMSTMGLGGDSRLWFDYKNQLKIGPERVEPLSMHENIPSPEKWLELPSNEVLYFLQTDEFDIYTEFKDFFTDKKYLTMDEIFEKAGAGEKTREIVSILVNKGLLGAAGLTPTDILSVLGEIEVPNKGAANEAVGIFAEYLGITGADFCKKIINDFQKTLSNTIMSFLIAHSSGKDESEIFQFWKNNEYFKIDFKSSIPIVGAGAAAKYFLPGVVEKISGELILPDNHEVGNAIGALLALS